MVEKIKKELRTTKGKSILFIVLCIILALGWFLKGAVIAAAPSKSSVREIVFKIQNMTFGENNPTIFIAPGETVRFTIYNFDKGMKHNFNIEGTEISTRILHYGEKESVLFSSPTVGEWTYFCHPHSSLMRGRLIVHQKTFL